MAKHLLTEKRIRGFLPKAKLYLVNDGAGLNLVVMPTGTKTWRLRYFESNGKEQSQRLGEWPHVSLEDARAKADEARSRVHQGEAPVAPRVVTRQVKTFAQVADEFLDLKESKWKAGRNAKANRKYLTERLGADLLAMPIETVTTPLILAALKPINAETKTVATRIYALVQEMLSFAVGSGYITANPMAGVKVGLVMKTKKRQNHPAIINPERLAEVLLGVRDYYRPSEGLRRGFVMARLMEVLFHTAHRDNEAREARWGDIDLVNNWWDVDASRMKMGVEHRVPITPRVREILLELQQHFPHEASDYVFPGQSKGSCVGRGSVVVAMATVVSGKEHVPHGCRATFRTIAEEVLEERPDLLEHQVAHKVKDPLGRAYNRTTHWQKRVEVMGRWSAYLDKLVKEAIRARRAA